MYIVRCTMYHYMYVAQGTMYKVRSTMYDLCTVPVCTSYRRGREREEKMTGQLDSALPELRMCECEATRAPQFSSSRGARCVGGVSSRTSYLYIVRCTTGTCTCVHGEIRTHTCTRDSRCLLSAARARGASVR